MGLAQVYGIVEQHDGFVDVSSKMGEGATFTIYLPRVATAVATEPAPSDQEIGSGQGQSILIVEDDEAVRAAMTAALDTLQYDVLAAANGAEALSLLDTQQVPVKLVITDLVMPHMGGRALIQNLRQRYPDIKILVVTGYPLGDSNEEFQEPGIVGRLQKPIEMRELSQRIASAIEHDSL